MPRSGGPAGRGSGARTRQQLWSPLARASLVASLVAAAAMATMLAAIGEIAAEETAVPGIESSSWTALTGVSSFLLGVDAFDGSFEPLSIGFGALLHIAMSVVLGLLGVALFAAVLGYRPDPSLAAVVGLAYGVLLEVLVLNVVINNIQDVKTVYDSVPSWGWWAAHAAYGVVLFTAAAHLFRRLGVEDPPRPVRARAAAASLSLR